MFKKQNEKGFTLIELMIVIAIIGILAAIAIPNFISYRDKAYCSAAENDANMIAAGLADYYAIPNHTTIIPTAAILLAKPAGLGLVLSGSGATINTATLTPPLEAIVIAVTDGSTRCPLSYQGANPEWAAGVYTKTMR